MAAVVQIVFDDIKLAKAFMVWLDNIGEQQYFQDNDDDCVAVHEFDYDYNHLRILTTKKQCK
jgi:hypothetical protein